MPIRFESRASKEEGILLLKTILSMVFFPSIPESARKNLASHIDWMDRQTETMEIDGRLETFPATKGTKITLMIGFGDKPTVRIQ